MALGFRRPKLMTISPSFALNSTQLNSTVKAMSTYGRKVCRSLTDSVLSKIRSAIAPTVRHVNFVKRPSVSVAARALNGVVGFHGFARV